MPADIHALPDEILALVLLEWFRSLELPTGEWHRYKFDYITSEGTGEWGYRQQQELRRIPFQAAGICRRWRAVALKTPSLWRHIRLDFDSLPRRKALMTLVKRSGAVPLRVILDNVGCSINARGAQNFWPLVHRVVGRAETLVVASLYDDCTPDRELFVALAQPNAVLVNFALTVTLERDTPYPRFPLSRSAPRLQCLRWTGPELYLHESHAAYPALREALISCAVARVSQVRRWFSRMPNLQKMELTGVDTLVIVRDVGAHARGLGHDVAPSSSLSELVTQHEFVEAIAETRFPALRRISITYPFRRVVDPAPLLVLLGQCADSLIGLNLHMHTGMGEETQRAVASLHSLRWLRLRASDETLAFLSGHARSLLAHHVEKIFIVGSSTGFLDRLNVELERISETLRKSGSLVSLKLVDENPLFEFCIAVNRESFSG